VVREVPRYVAGTPSANRQASDDDRDGGNVLGRLATHGQHGVVLAAPGRHVRIQTECHCPEVTDESTYRCACGAELVLVEAAEDKDQDAR
jgi:hypothetical protein